MEISIKIKCQDESDVKMHLSVIREQILFALKNPSTIDGTISYEGVNSNHRIDIILE